MLHCIDGIVAHVPRLSSATHWLLTLHLLKHDTCKSLACEQGVKAGVERAPPK